MSRLLQGVLRLSRNHAALRSSLISRGFYQKNSGGAPGSQSSQGAGANIRSSIKKIQLKLNSTTHPGDELLTKGGPTTFSWRERGLNLNPSSKDLKFLTGIYEQGMIRAKLSPQWAGAILSAVSVVRPGAYKTSGSKSITTKVLRMMSLGSTIVFLLYLMHLIGWFSLFEWMTGVEEDESDFDSRKASMRALSEMSKDKRDEPVERPDTKFDDIKGINEIRQQLEQVVDYIMNKQKYDDMGAQPPRGILLSGPPGCGKTLLGRALAGECGVPFYFVASATIDGMYVGTGVKRLTGIFKAARSHSEGAIIFMDEIDAIGGGRTKGEQMNPYARMTINKLLAEMDGFNTTDKVIVVASTNLPEVLDKALTRSGRFDQHISVPRPMKEDRMEIMKYYLDSIVCTPDIDVERFCGTLAGAVGADIATIVNTAAHIAAKKQKDAVDNDDMEEAIKKQLFGTEQKTRLACIPERDIKVAAYHEAGKALVNKLLGCKSKLVTTTVVPRNGKVGKSKYIDLEYTDNKIRDDFMHDLCQIMAGPIAESVATTQIFGRKNEAMTMRDKDFQSAKKLAMQMVSKWGMGQGEAKLMFHVHEGSSQYLRKLVEEEAHRIIKEQTQLCQKLLGSNRHKLITLADALLKYETMSGKEVSEVIDTGSIESVAILRAKQKEKVETMRKERLANVLVDLDRDESDGSN